MLTTLVKERQTCATRLAELDAAIVLELAALHQAVPQDPDLLDAKTAARRLGISTVYLYELARLQKIPSTRIGRTVKFRPTDIATYGRTL